MTHIPAPAQYLLRVDDLCPTMHAGHWEHLRDMILESGIHPVLSVIPDNRDPDLSVSAPDPHFWQQMRAMEAAGATIALHGYRHLCAQHGRSLVPLHRFSEFGGVAFEQQVQWIEAGLAILGNHGLKPRLWVAPRHGFDRATLRALRQAGLAYLSDGFTRVPVRRSGVLWIPQQLWRPAEKATGLWTICIHPNTMTATDAAELQAFLRSQAVRFTSFERVIETFAEGVFPLWERAQDAVLTARFLLRAALRRATR
jgi:predicted deacetylase